MGCYENVYPQEKKKKEKRKEQKKRKKNKKKKNELDVTQMSVGKNSRAWRRMYSVYAWRRMHTSDRRFSTIGCITRVSVAFKSAEQEKRHLH